MLLEEIQSVQKRKQILRLWEAFCLQERSHHVLVVIHDDGSLFDTTELPTIWPIENIKKTFLSSIEASIRMCEDPTALTIVSITNLDMLRAPEGLVTTRLTEIRKALREMSERTRASYLELNGLPPQ